MRKFNHISALLVSALCLGSCEKDLNLDKYNDPEVTNMLVVNSIINPDSVMKVSVTHPYFLATTHTSFPPVEGLDVRMSGSSGEWHPLAFDGETGMYVSQQKPVAGETIGIRICRGEELISCSDEVPRKVEIEDVTVSREGPIHIYWDDDYRFNYKITFTDTPGEENYYFLHIVEDWDALHQDGNVDFSFMGQVDYSYDYVFQVLADMVNSDTQGWGARQVAYGYPFCDKGIDGQRYTLTVSEILQHPWTGRIKSLPRIIRLYSVSKAYFEYMVNVLQMDYDEDALKGNLLSLGLVEPSKVYSNIEGGTGLMGSYNLATWKIDILEQTGGWHSNQ